MSTNSKKCILLGLNEVNFHYIQSYAEQGYLPHLQALMERAPLVQTSSEEAYEELEPWIQWVSIQTGKTYAEHKIFRLGDMVEQDFAQIWEHLEDKYEAKVAAISPMNAANRCKNPAFFVPDPWTKTECTGDWLLQKLSAAVSNAVNENATGGSKISSYFYVLLGVLKYSLWTRNIDIIALILKGLRTHYQRAILLDQLLADIFVYHWRKNRPDFSSLFLNSCAHLQHHYMFNAAPYEGPNKNPKWYVRPDSDPLLEGFQRYDKIVGQIVNLPDNPRVIIATGLHQTPVENPVFYWRLNKHSEFLDQIGIVHQSVAPRMSRDFLVTFEDAESCRYAEDVLRSCKDANGTFIFEEVDNRGDSLFVTLTYNQDIDADFTLRYEGGSIDNFRSLISFVALKNGEHDGQGFVIDSENQIAADQTLPITDLFGLIDNHFAGQNIAQKQAA